MTALLSAVEDYLALRRRLGFSLQRAEKLLPDFVGHLDRAGESHVTTESAIAWAILPQSAKPAWWCQRLDLVLEPLVKGLP